MLTVCLSRKRAGSAESEETFLLYELLYSLNMFYYMNTYFFSLKNWLNSIINTPKSRFMGLSEIFIKYS